MRVGLRAPFQDTAKLGSEAFAIVAWAKKRACRAQGEATMATGTVKFFNHSRGYGFIEQTEGGPDVFVHATAVEKAGIPSIDAGQKVNFDIETDSRSGKSTATNLQFA